jgi:hypothetical protein
MNTRIVIFECSANTYPDCIQMGLFGSNLPWPLQVKSGDICFLYHYEVATLFGVWRADGGGARNIVPKAWSGRFPFQVRVKPVSPDIVEVPKDIVVALTAGSSDGRLANMPSPELTRALLDWASAICGPGTGSQT